MIWSPMIEARWVLGVVRGGSLDGGESRHYVFSLPVSINTILGTSLAEAPPISQIILTIPSQVLHSCSDKWSNRLFSDPSAPHPFLIQDEKSVWNTPTPTDLESPPLLKAVSKGMRRIVHLLLLDPSTDPNVKSAAGYIHRTRDDCRCWVYRDCSNVHWCRGRYRGKRQPSRKPVIRSMP